MRIRMLVLLAALLFLATGIVSCQQNFAQIGGYQISVGSIPYGGTVNGNMLGGISSTVSWSIMIQPRSENLNDMAYRILADGKYTEQESIGTFPVTIDGKEGAYAIGVADLNILNTQSGLFEPTPTPQYSAVYNIDDQVDCAIYVLGSETLFKDILNTIHVQ